MAITGAKAPSVWHDLPVVLARFLRLPFALAIALGLTVPAEAQLWKPTKKKPGSSIKAKTKPAPRKVGKPTKRKPKAARARPKRAPVEAASTQSGDEDNAPIITIYPGDDE